MIHHESNAGPFHSRWEEVGYVLIRATKCDDKKHGGSSCYDGTTDPSEAARWLTENPDGHYFLKGSVDDPYDKTGGGWTQVDGLNFYKTVNRLRWEPSIAAGMEIEACRVMEP